MMKRSSVLGVVAALLAALSFAATPARAETRLAADRPAKLPPAADKKDVTYAGDINPIFEKSCFRCHAAGKPRADLRLDTLELALKGSEDGKVIKPGNSAESVLVLNVAHLGKRDKFMPPPKNKANIAPLTAEQVSLIRAWIDQGAK
jgi:hypothetical protein